MAQVLCNKYENLSGLDNSYQYLFGHLTRRGTIKELSVDGHLVQNVQILRFENCLHLLFMLTDIFQLPTRHEFDTNMKHRT